MKANNVIMKKTKHTLDRLALFNGQDDRIDQKKIKLINPMKFYLDRFLQQTNFVKCSFPPDRFAMTPLVFFPLSAFSFHYQS